MSARWLAPLPAGARLRPGAHHLGVSGEVASCSAQCSISRCSYAAMASAAPAAALAAPSDVQKQHSMMQVSMLSLPDSQDATSHSRQDPISVPAVLLAAVAVTHMQQAALHSIVHEIASVSTDLIFDALTGDFDGVRQTDESMPAVLQVLHPVPQHRTSLGSLMDPLGVIALGGHRGCVPTYTTSQHLCPWCMLSSSFCKACCPAAWLVRASCCTKRDAAR